MKKKNLQCDDPIRVICMCATSGLGHVEISIPIFFWSSSPTFTVRPIKIRHRIYEVEICWQSEFVRGLTRLSEIVQIGNQ
jgi:hypothetical protein